MDIASIIILFILIVQTYANNLSLIDEVSNGKYVIILVLMIFSNVIFDTEKKVITAVYIFWWMSVASIINQIIFGYNSFTLGDRFLLVMNVATGEIVSMDPNYFCSLQAMALVLTVLFYINRKKLNEELGSKFPKFLFNRIFFLIIAFLQLWFAFRGLSRGAMLILIIGYLTVIFITNQNKRINYIIIAVVLLLCIYQMGFIDLIIDRTNVNELTTGRTFLFSLIFSYMMRSDVDSLLFGYGNQYPWYDSWRDNWWNGLATSVSTHNQYLTIWMAVGTIGLCLFFYTLLKNTKLRLKDNSFHSILCITLTVCFLVECTNLEPLTFSRPMIFLPAILMSNYKKNYEYRIINR
jgi:hypothetical protein